MGPATWAAQWRALLSGNGERGDRAIAQGRAYQRSGRVTDLQLGTGHLSGRVQGRQATPRAVEVTVTVLGDAEWSTIGAVLARQLRYSARLLAGLEPDGLTEELAAAGVSLLPSREEVRTTCGCGRTQPCAHAAAVWETATERIIEDPFTLLRLRGRGRERLLADLAAGRAGPSEQADVVAVGELHATGWNTASSPLEELHLPALHLRDGAASPLRLLGDPPGWPRGPRADELMAPLVERAARWARACEDAHDP